MFIATLIGFCIFAVIFALVAYKNAGKGKKYKSTLIGGFVFYAVVLLGTIVGGSDPVSIVGCIVSFILLGVMFPICEKNSKKSE